LRNEPNFVEFGEFFQSVAAGAFEGVETGLEALEAGLDDGEGVGKGVGGAEMVVVVFRVEVFVPALEVLGVEVGFGQTETADDVGFGMKAGLEGVHAGDRFAGLGAGAGGFLRITAIRFDLGDGGHNGKAGHGLRSSDSTPVEGRWRVDFVIL
jgi:hypothetical protein